MKTDLEKLFSSVVKHLAHNWDISVQDLTQDLWLWYHVSKSSKVKVDEVPWKQAFNLVKAEAVRIIRNQMLDDNLFQGEIIYSAEMVKDVLKGVSDNRYLKDLVPIAMNAINEEYAEALRVRYTDGVILPDKQSKNRLTRSHQALTKQVNILCSKVGKVGRDPVPAESRAPRGGVNDPTANTALALIQRGDDVIITRDKEGNLMQTTYRDEIMNNVFDDWFVKPTKRSKVTFTLSLVEDPSKFCERPEMYQAQVFPEEYPNEKPMLIDNWSDEDRRAYCGGQYTPGYLRLVKD